MQPEHAFLLLLNLCDTWFFHLYALFLLQPAAANYIITARPQSAPFYCNLCFPLNFLLNSKLVKFIPDSFKHLKFNLFILKSIRKMD